MATDGKSEGAMQQNIRFEREWAMPNKQTFQISPIREFVESEITDSEGMWIDPFSGGCEFADLTNDLNPEKEADYHEDAVEFLERFDDGEIDGGVLFDPPYSPRQIKECYESVGLETSMETTQARFWSNVKEQIERVCGTGATVVTCSWNSGGVGKNAGFTLRRVLLVPHGGWHNDTIVTAEDRTRSELTDFQQVPA